MDTHGAVIDFQGAVADRPETAAALVAHLEACGLRPQRGDHGWRVTAPGAVSADDGCRRVSAALRDAATVTRTCLAVSVRGF